jgi:hypothetical protein
MKKAVIGVVSTLEGADHAAGRLQADGFRNEDISVLFPDKDSTKSFSHEHHTKAPEGAVTGVGAGGAVGGALGLLAGLGALAIPGLGPFIAAGPIMGALSGAAAGASVGGVAGALIGLGIPEYEAKAYEGKLKEGNILVAVHTEDGAERKRAVDAFKSAGAKDVSTQAETGVPKNERAGR